MKLAMSGLAISVALMICAPAWSHGDDHARKAAPKAFGPSKEKSFGTAGDPKKATRSVAVDMSDTMRFNPASISVKQGETVKFVVKNSGKTMHEFVLGTMQELKEHSELMKKHPGMEHDEPYMAHVPPGKTETIVWRFTKAGEFHFGCLLPGHFEAGMVGKVSVGK